MRAQPLFQSRPSTFSAVVIALVGMLTSVTLSIQGSRGVAVAATSGPTAGIGTTRWGSTFAQASGYDRYSYISVGLGDAAAAAAQPGKSLVYVSGTTVRGNWGGIDTGVPLAQAQASGWLLKDASGNLVLNASFGAYVGDFGSLAYQQAWVANVAGFLAANGDDGVFIDDVLADARGLTGGVYPAKYPSQSAWENAQVSFIAYVGQALKSRGYYVLVNAAAYVGGDARSNTGELTSLFWQRLAPSVNGLCSEYWVQLSTDINSLRPSGSASWTQYWDGWANLVNVAQNAGDDFFGLMYGGSTSLNTMRYGKASFLLNWDGGGGALIYDTGGDPWNPEWTMDIGQPSGAKYQVGVGWRRDYTAGTALVNPSPTTSQTYNLGATYTQPNGTTATTITLPPASGITFHRKTS